MTTICGIEKYTWQSAYYVLIGKWHILSITTLT